MQKIKVNDEVVVLAGKDKGKSGKIVSLNFKTDTVLVEGVNMKKKAVRPTQENPEGGLMDVERPLHISNVAVKSPKTGAASRVKIVVKDGKAKRVLSKCGSELN